MPKPPRAPVPPSDARRGPEELLGYLEGIEHRLAGRRRAGAPEPKWERVARQARRELDADDWDLAAQHLRKVDDHLRETEPEAELREFPRGLTQYVPRGERGEPAGPEDDLLTNRLVLASRLLEVRRRQGHEVTEAHRELGKAEGALRAGDRLAARRYGDAALRLLEAMGSEGAQR